MVVRMMKWRPWPPLSSKKFEAKIVLCRLQGLPEKPTNDAVGGDVGGDSRDFSRLGVEVKWKGSVKSNNRLNFKRGGVKRNLTKEGSLNDNGVVEWNEEFVSVCDLVGFRDGCFHQWEVAFTVFDGLNQGPKKWDREVATGSLNLAEFAYAEQEKTPLSIHLVPSGVECSPILNVSVSLLELRTTHGITESPQRSPMPLNGDEPSVLKAGLKKVKIFRAISAKRAKKASREEEGSFGKSSVGTEGSDDPFDSDSLDGIDSEEVDYSDSNLKKSLSYETLAYANHVGGSSLEDRIYYRSCNTKKEHVLSASAIDRSESQTLKKSIFPWKKRKLHFRSPKPKGEPLLKRNVREEGGDDIDFDRRMLTSSDDSTYGWQGSDEGSTTSRSSISEFGDDSFIIGKWANKEITSRDGLMKLKTQVFFASIDQRSRKASGESACTSLVATIANWFQNNPHHMPIKSELDTLIHEGSLEWRNLCENEIYKKQFPDKHFDLETVLESKTRNIVVVPEKSFVGFFQPNGLEEGVFEFLDGAMSFDTIWDEIGRMGSSSNHSNDIDPLVYIVSWNDHFFVLKVERDAYYIIDTLGERLYEGCNQAYILKFDQDTTIQRLPQDTKKSNEESMVVKGKDSCKEYIKSFLAAIPLRELQADVKKGLMADSSPLVHHRLQIEFHYTTCLQPVSSES